MKKKVVYFLFSLFLVFSFSVINMNSVYALGSEGAPTISIKPTGKIVPSGYVGARYSAYDTIDATGDANTSYSTFQSENAAIARCTELYKTQIANGTRKCNAYKVDVYTCNGNYYDTKKSCTASYKRGTCTQNKARTETKCTGVYGSVWNNFTFKGTSGGKSSYTRCNTYCKLNCVCSSTVKAWKFSADEYETNHHAAGITYKPLNIWTYVNASASNEPTYCIQPGNKAPSSGGTEYCLNDNANLNACTSINDYYFCGLGYILSLTAKETGKDADGKIIYQYKTPSDSGYYSYEAITIALRMWVAYWNAEHPNGSNTLANADGDGYENPKAFQYITNTQLYKTTAYRAAKNGYLGYKDYQWEGVIYGNYQQYKDAITIFNETNAGTKPNEFFKTLSSTEAVKKPTVNSVTINGDDATMEIDLPEEFSKIQVACTKEELFGKTADPACKVLVTIKDENNVVIKPDDPRIVSGFCDKEHCTIVLSGVKTCEKYTNKKQAVTWSYKVTLKDWGTKEGYARQYINCNGANNSQVMMTFAINQVKNEEALGNYIPTTSISGKIRVKCPCDPKKYCNVEKQQGIENLPSECEGNEVLNSGEYDSYVKATKEDPYMNCILNACYPEDKDEYDYSTEYGVNTNVCRIYCRQDVNFYMANKTRVYAGMQFSYNIGTKLIEDNVIKTQVADGRKLTSVVLQERQCTTEIYYDKKAADGLTWLDRYKTAVLKMAEKWNEWKKWEALNLDGYDTTAHTAAGINSCTCSTTDPYTKSVNILTWPKTGTNGGYKIVTINNYTLNKGTFQTSNGGTSASLSDGDAPKDDGTSYTHSCEGECCEAPKSCCCSRPCSGCSVNKRSNGKEGVDVVSGYADAAKNEYDAAKKVVSQLLYDLQNCNSYTSAEINDPYGVASSAINGGTSKDYILKKTACEKAEDCIDLEVGYDDKNYGKSVLFDKEIKVTDSELNQTYYCKEGEQSNPDCYDYIENTENEINAKNYNKNKMLQKHNYLSCSGDRESAECISSEISLPTSDYATFITVTEADFWQPQKFQTEAFTGKVTKVDDAMAESENTTSLGESVFPVSKNKESGSTGSYGVDYKFTKITSNGNNKLSTYDFSCSYDIYNIMNLYDCEISYDADGQVDISGCSNNCYEVIDNVPIIKDGCTAWSTDNTTSKGYGFIYRNVDLSNLFPTTRPVGDNWSKEDTKITEIQESSDDVFINDEYLEYSFVLTPNAIRKIRNYNSENSSKGSSGYLNNTLESCEKIPVSEGSTLYSFYNCKSSFITSIKDENSGFEVKTIKGDGISIHNSKTIGGGK